MANITNNLENTRRITSLFREFVLIGIIILLVVSPKTIRVILQNAGIQSIAGIEFRNDLEKTSNDTKKAIEQIGTLRDSLDILQTQLTQAIQRSTDVATKTELRKIQSTINATTAEVETAGRNLRDSYSTQKDILEQVDISSRQESGWIFLGKVNGNKTEWTKGRPENVTRAEIPIKINDLLRIKTDVYLRERSESRESKGEILDIVKEGEGVEVLDIDYSKARGGGWFVWVKVRRI